MADRDHESTVSADTASAIEQFRLADAQLRRRRQVASGPREIDRQALRLVSQAHEDGVPLTAKELARSLEISTASTTILLDRLTEAGLVMRRPHPTDRRAISILPTGRSLELGDRLTQRIRAVADELDPEEAAIVTRFLRRVTDVLDEESR